METFKFQLTQYRPNYAYLFEIAEHTAREKLNELTFHDMDNSLRNISLQLTHTELKVNDTQDDWLYVHTFVLSYEMEEPETPF